MSSVDDTAAMSQYANYFNQDDPAIVPEGAYIGDIIYNKTHYGIVIPGCTISGVIPPNGRISVGTNVSRELADPTLFYYTAPGEDLPVIVEWIMLDPEVHADLLEAAAGGRKVSTPVRYDYIEETYFVCLPKKNGELELVPLDDMTPDTILTPDLNTDQSPNTMTSKGDKYTPNVGIEIKEDGVEWGFKITVACGPMKAEAVIYDAGSYSLEDWRSVAKGEINLWGFRGEDGGGISFEDDTYEISHPSEGSNNISCTVWAPRDEFQAALTAALDRAVAEGRFA